MTNLYYGTIKQLLERVASVMVDRESTEHLIEFVKEALEDGPIVEELGLGYVEGESVSQSDKFVTVLPDSKFDPLLPLDCARVEGAERGGAIQGKQGIKFFSVA